MGNKFDFSRHFKLNYRILSCEKSFLIKFKTEFIENQIYLFIIRIRIYIKIFIGWIKYLKNF